MTPDTLAGQRALVCGSTRGIGRACAEALAAMGAGTTLLARDAAALEELVGKLPAAQGQDHRFITIDFADPHRVAEAVATHAQTAGTFQILINNTGGPPGGPLIDATPEAFEAAMRSHLVVNHLLMQTLLPGMKAARYGRIVNIISTSVKEPIPGLGVSNTTRLAVAGWAKTISRELAPHGITVNNVLPGFTDTQRLQSLIATRAEREGRSVEAVTAAMVGQVPTGRFARPEEIAAMAAFLASPDASYVTGTSIPVDGGRTGSI